MFCMTLYAIAVSLPKIYLRWDADDTSWEPHFVRHRAKTAETTERQAEDEHFNLASITTLICTSGAFFLSSAETEAFDVAMFAAQKMRKVKE